MATFPTIKKWVRDTKLARKMYPDVLESTDGKILVDTGIELQEPVILGVEGGFTYGTLNGLFKQTYAKQVSNMIPNGVKLYNKVKK